MEKQKPKLELSDDTLDRPLDAEVSLEGIVDALFLRSDECTFKILHRIANVGKNTIEK